MIPRSQVSGSDQAIQGRFTAMAADMSSGSPTQASDTNGTPSIRWSSISRRATWGIWGTIGLFALSQPFLWAWDSPVGASLTNMISESMLIVGILLALVWVAQFSGWERSSRTAVLASALALIGGFIASIRYVDLDGNIGLTFEYRWQPTQAERIAAHKAKLAADPAKNNVPRSSEATSESTPAIAELPALTPEDMPAYRGANRDGVVIGPQIRTAWETAPQPLWQQPCGGGYASMAIVGDLLVTIEQRDDNETVLCYRASTGRELWKYEYPAHFWEGMGGPGPRSTPTIDGDLVFVQGALGDLVCLELATGKPRWTKNLLTLFNLPNTQWGMTCSPLVVDNRIIANAGGRRGDGLVAFDRSTGDVLWAAAGLSLPPTDSPAPATAATPVADDSGHAKVPESGQNRPGYSSPTLVTIHGVRQILNFDGTGVRGCDIETGKTLWFYPHENGPAVNAAQPILFDDGRVFISCSYNVGCAMVQVAHTGETWSATKLWANNNMRCKMTSPILFEGYLYGLDEGYLTCLDPQTGDRSWKRSREGAYQHGQLLLTNGIIVALAEDGRCVFVKPNPQKLEELGQFAALSSNYKTWNPPALARGKLYVRNHHDMACFDLGE